MEDALVGTPTGSPTMAASGTYGEVMISPAGIFFGSFRNLAMSEPKSPASSAASIRSLYWTV